MVEHEKARLKAILGYVAYATGLGSRHFQDKYLIIAFHRINDATLGDGISCAPARFREICIWLAEHFDVVPLREQIAAVERDGFLAASASITFDDGYRDNYEIAAPILAELGLPATFFVTTDFIGTDHVPAWDSNRGTATEWMSWDQVAELVRQGFDVESHTCSHVDLGTAASELARHELVMSLDRLGDLPRQPHQLFAYPFGAPGNITDETRSLVRESGYRCCLSCYGGINVSDTDPYYLRRVPVNEEYIYPHQLGFELLRQNVAPIHNGRRRPRPKE
jgi:peptidoglycan/xylan/chitin deacetylase (PgdA/CDA1 family)